MDSVEYLARLVDWKGTGASEVDWSEVEQRLDLPLPSDFRALVERFPWGIFRGHIVVGNPGLHRGKADLIAGMSVVLDDMRDWGIEEGLVPYPVYPEPGGLVPWGGGPGGAPICWLTIGADPDAWQVVLGSSDFEIWENFAGGAARFILAVLTREFKSEIIKLDDGPLFRPFLYVTAVDWRVIEGRSGAGVPRLTTRNLGGGVTIDAFLDIFYPRVPAKPKKMLANLRAALKPLPLAQLTEG